MLSPAILYVDTWTYFAFFIFANLSPLTTPPRLMSSISVPDEKCFTLAAQFITVSMSSVRSFSKSSKLVMSPSMMCSFLSNVSSYSLEK